MMPIRSMVSTLLGFSAILACNAACQSATDSVDLVPIQGTSPVQLRIDQDPQITRHPDLDSALLIVSVTGPDSSPHREWRPTAIRVSSDRGYDREFLAVPFACIDPNDSGLPFPFNFTWRSCNHVGVESRILLATHQLQQLENVMSGKLVATFVFRTIPGASYTFEVPPGSLATTEAARRAKLFDFVSTAHRVSRDPLCVRSDIVPPPPCPPWFLLVLVPFSYSSATTDSIPVRSGGWVRATYVDADGTQRMSEYMVP